MENMENSSNKTMRNVIIALASIIVLAGAYSVLTYNPTASEEQCEEIQNSSPIDIEQAPY